MRRRKKVLLVLYMGLFLTKKLYAYLDPGSGSYIFQLLLGVLFGFIFTLKSFWKKIKSFFGKFFSKGNRQNEK